MGFWIRNIIIAIILIGLAYTFFINQDLLLSLNDSSKQETKPEIIKPKKAASESESEPVNNKTDTTTQVSEKKFRKPNNAAAEGLSKFYAKVYGDDIGKEGPKIRNNIIYLPEHQENLIEVLQTREMVVSPYSQNWQGTTASRRFSKGETLFQKLAEYAKQDDLEIIWWLNRDFIVKDAFRIEKNILKTAYQIGEAVSGHFPEGINSYFCYRQRTVVFINEAPKYLTDECSSLKPKNAY